MCITTASLLSIKITLDEDVHTYIRTNTPIDKKQLATQLCAGEVKVFNALTVTVSVKFTVASHAATSCKILYLIIVSTNIPTTSYMKQNVLRLSV